MTAQKWKDLGHYVRVKDRKDGTHAVSLMVPARHRTASWPKSIRLPEYGDSRGSLADFRFKRAVIADATRLYSYLQEERRLETRRSKLTERGLPELAEIYLNSDEYRLKCNHWGQYRNRRILTIILEWSASRGHPEFAEIKKSDINSQLRAFDDRPSDRLSLRCMWNKLCRIAMEEFGRSDNPCLNMRGIGRRLRPFTSGFPKLSRDMRRQRPRWVSPVSRPSCGCNILSVNAAPTPACASTM